MKCCLSDMLIGYYILCNMQFCVICPGRISIDDINIKCVCLTTHKCDLSHHKIFCTLFEPAFSAVRLIKSLKTDVNARCKCGLSFCFFNCRRSNKLPPAILLKRLPHLHQHFIYYK